MIRVSNSGGIDLSTGGDSGSPWSSGNIAYGFHAGGIGNDSYYMAQNYADVLGLCVLHGVANTPAPSVSGSLVGSSVRLSWLATGHCGYEVHRSQDPYFVASDTTIVSTLDKTGASFSSSVGVGDTDGNYYYSINVVTGSSAQSSTALGEFDFNLVPGS